MSRSDGIEAMGERDRWSGIALLRPIQPSVLPRVSLASGGPWTLLGGRNQCPPNPYASIGHASTPRAFRPENSVRNAHRTRENTGLTPGRTHPYQGNAGLSGENRKRVAESNGCAPARVLIPSEFPPLTGVKMRRDTFGGRVQTCWPMRWKRFAATRIADFVAVFERSISMLRGDQMAGL